MTMFAAHRFDGRYGVAVPVWVRIVDGSLIVETVDHRRLDCEPLAQASFSESLESAPHLILLRNGATLELRDPDRAFDLALEGAGVARSWVVRMQSHWLLAACAVVIVIALSTVAYRSALPIAASWVAARVSPELEQRMGNEILAILDQQRFKPSRLERQRQAEIAADFAQAAHALAPGVRYRLELRRGEPGEINAFALPGGIIVLLDRTVTYGDQIDRDSVFGVLGHELGHVSHRHPTRMLAQHIGAGALANLLWGDFSSIAASFPLMLGQLSYSRDFESAADDFAVELLRVRQRTAQPLYRFFVCLQQLPGGETASAIPNWLSSHPATARRISRMRELSGVSEASPTSCPAPR